MRVRVYRFAAPGEPWQLEVTASNGNTMTWEELFERDEDASKVFADVLKQRGGPFVYSGERDSPLIPSARSCYESQLPSSGTHWLMHQDGAQEG